MDSKNPGLPGSGPSEAFNKAWEPQYAKNASNVVGTAREGAAALQKTAATLAPQVVPSINDKESVFSTLMQGPNGLKRVAFAMQQPLKDRLDYVAVGRKLLLIDELPQGEVPQYDLDMPEFGAVKIAARGKAPQVEQDIKRVEFPTFPIATDGTVKWEEIQIRRYPAFDRAKERVAIANAIGEDLEVFNLINAATNVGPNPVEVLASPLPRTAWVDLYGIITGNQLAPGAYLMHPLRFRDILKFDNTQLDQVSLNITVTTGMFGVLHGTRLIVTTKISPNSVYMMTTPDKLGRIPERKAVEIKIWDNIPNNQYDIVSWEQIGLGIHNTAGVARIDVTGDALTSGVELI